VVTYTPDGSGAGLRSWGSESKSGSEVSFSSENSFVGTDEPPNPGQQQEIQKQENPLTEETLDTIPVAQESVAIIVNLPSGCVATTTTTGVESRLALSDKQLQGIYSGEVTKWGEITGDGDSLSPASCDNEPITPIVRADQSGTTHILKRFLGLIDPNPLRTASGEKTWGQLSEGALNTVWPESAKTVHASATGGSGLIAKVLEVPGSVGYVNLAEARESAAFVPTAGGAGKPTFWVWLEKGASGSGEKEKLTYAEPATNGEVAAKGEANCAKTAYTNGEEPFPPPSVTYAWNEVTTSVPKTDSVEQKDYPLCGLTYDLAFSSYSDLEAKGARSAAATTIHDYLSYVVEKAGGQKELGGSDYAALPKSVAVIAERGAKGVGFYSQ
jgi:ABC-type phosphate transport system substrate-binding protein